jgi:hypothetical protein
MSAEPIWRCEKEEGRLEGAPGTTVPRRGSRHGQCKKHHLIQLPEDGLI